MTVRTFELDVAIADRAGLIDVMDAIERAVRRASPQRILAAELRLPGVERRKRNVRGHKADKETA